VLEQIQADLRSLTQLPQRERAAMLANLQNRLSVFLRPPFLALCGHSDFQIAEVCAGKRVAFLLSVGAFPDVARQLGRIALSQFKNAVLADNPSADGASPIEKYAVLDELHNFISADFGAFLNQARGRLGGAVMGMQSLGDFPRETVQAMLGTTRSFIVTPGVGVEDRAYFAELFGKHHVEQQSVSAPPGRLWQTDPPSSVRRELVERYRHTPTEIAELPPEYAYIRLTDRRRTYPVTRVRVERRPGARPGRARPRIGAPR
jgi:type IV secretory pathway TraG/TraD family ATPase VirD4